MSSICSKSHSMSVYSSMDTVFERRIRALAFRSRTTSPCRSSETVLIYGSTILFPRLAVTNQGHRR